jgi:hypothetical protein
MYAGSAVGNHGDGPLGLCNNLVRLSINVPRDAFEAVRTDCLAEVQEFPKVFTPDEVYSIARLSVCADALARSAERRLWYCSRGSEMS